MPRTESSEISPSGTSPRGICANGNDSTAQGRRKVHWVQENDVEIYAK